MSGKSRTERTKGAEAREGGRSGVLTHRESNGGCSRGRQLRGERAEKCRRPEHMGPCQPPSSLSETEILQGWH